MLFASKWSVYMQLCSLSGICRLCVIYCLFISASLAMEELPQGLSKDIIKSHSKYVEEIAGAVELYSKKMHKELKKHSRSQKKIVDKMTNLGEISGLVALNARLQELTSGAGKDLLGGDLADNKVVELTALPESAQDLEKKYEAAIAVYLLKAAEEMNEYRADYNKALLKERKVLVKGKSFAVAEKLQTYIDALAKADYAEPMQKIYMAARCVGFQKKKVDIASLSAGTSKTAGSLDGPPQADYWGKCHIVY
ncbi:MAG: hypothetical protein HRU15_06650, partial [Planctomycetes bacterium]|nr:hypothetical protein [Planctomycetota bacterium]